LQEKANIAIYKEQPEMIEINGKTYREADAPEAAFSCSGCAGHTDVKLCEALPDGCITAHIVYVLAPPPEGGIPSHGNADEPHASP